MSNKPRVELTVHENPREPQAKVAQHVTVEMAAFAVSILLLYQQHPELINSFVPLLFEDLAKLPVREEILKKVKPSVRQASEIVSALQIFEGFLQNKTAQGAVAFFYIIYRYLLYQGNTPSRAESIELWKVVWKKAKDVALVATEWEEMEKRGDLKGWKADLQESARRQLRTFKAQLPRVEKNGAEIYRMLFTFIFGEEEPSQD